MSRLPGIGSHHSTAAQSDEWYTPPEVWEHLPVFDLDPCAPSTPVPWAKAARTFTIADDGMAQHWEGHVWLNPPYSEVERWIVRLADHGDGMALVFARTDTRWWFSSIWPSATRLLFLRGRVTFWSPNPDPTLPGVAPSTVRRSKHGHNSGGPSVLVAFGAWASEQLAVTSRTLPGALVEVRHHG